MASWPGFYEMFRRVSAMMPSLSRLSIGRVVYRTQFGDLPARQRASDLMAGRTRGSSVHATKAAVVPGGDAFGLEGHDHPFGGHLVEVHLGLGVTDTASLIVGYDRHQLADRLDIIGDSGGAGHQGAAVETRPGRGA